MSVYQEALESSIQSSNLSAVVKVVTRVDFANSTHKLPQDKLSLTPRAALEQPSGDLMQAAAEVSVAAVQSGVRDDDSDYGDFASDEEDIIIDLLSSIPVPNEPSEAPLIVTDIEDYEEPRGVRLPKVLGTERWPGKWQPQVHFQREDQGLRSDITSTRTYHCSCRSLCSFTDSLTSD
jgi:hypothetical protein